MKTQFKPIIFILKIIIRQNVNINLMHDTKEVLMPSHKITSITV